jgi:hypothetical protein
MVNHDATTLMMTLMMMLMMIRMLMMQIEISICSPRP